LHFRPATPVTPPFPYTTLFRSGEHSREPHDRAPNSNRAELQPERVLPEGHRRLLVLPHGLQRPAPGEPDEELHQEQEPERDREQDRKSTRLNSSHEWISYAVFC